MDSPDDLGERLKDLEAEMEALKKAKDAFEEESIALTNKDASDDRYAKLAKCLQENFGGSPVLFQINLRNLTPQL